jgi:hypothetical protein
MKCQRKGTLMIEHGPGLGTRARSNGSSCWASGARSGTGFLAFEAPKWGTAPSWAVRCRSFAARLAGPMPSSLQARLVAPRRLSRSAAARSVLRLAACWRRSLLLWPRGGGSHFSLLFRMMSSFGLPKVGCLSPGRKAVPVSFPADPLPIGLLARYCSSD